MGSVHSRADQDSGILFIGTYAADCSRSGEETNWHVTNLLNASEAFVLQNCQVASVEPLQLH